MSTPVDARFGSSSPDDEVWNAIVQDLNTPLSGSDPIGARVDTLFAFEQKHGNVPEDYEMPHIEDLGVNLNELLSDLGLSSLYQSYGLLLRKDNQERLRGLVKPLDGEGKFRRLTINSALSKSNQSDWAKVWDVRLDNETGEVWKLPVQGKIQPVASGLQSERHAWQPPYLQFDADDSLQLRTSEGYEKEFRMVKQTGQLVTGNEVLKQIEPFFRAGGEGVGVDLTDKITEYS